MPPGQAKKWAVGHVLPRDVIYYDLPASLTVRLSAPPGSIIINTGDYMQRISNDLLPSTTHRVGKPRDASHLAEARVSFPIAVYLWENELLEVLPGLGPPRYEPIKAVAFHTRSTSKFYGDDYAVDSA